MNQPDLLFYAGDAYPPKSILDLEKSLAFVQNELREDHKRLSKAKNHNEPQDNIDRILHQITVMEAAVDKYQAWIKKFQE